MVGHYESFFITSAGASAAILGLLVVAVSVVNADDANPTTRELRTVLAGSAFVALVDIFIVSIVALTGGSVVFGLSSLAMATVGLLATRGLIPRAKRAGNFSRSSRTRTLNIAFASISAGGLLSAARPRRSAPGEHPECRAATCFGPRHCGFVLQRPWSGMGGHRDNPAGIRSRAAAAASATQHRGLAGEWARNGHRARNGHAAGNAPREDQLEGDDHAPDLERWERAKGIGPS